MSLAEIRAAIGPGADLEAALRRRLDEIDQRIGELGAQRSVTTQILSKSPPTPACSLVTLPATVGVVVSDTVDADDLAGWIRRHIQRLRRRECRDGERTCVDLRSAVRARCRRRQSRSRSLRSRRASEIPCGRQVAPSRSSGSARMRDSPSPTTRRWRTSSTPGCARPDACRRRTTRSAAHPTRPSPS